MGRLSYNTERFTKVNKYDVANDAYNGILVAAKINQKNGQDYKLLDVIDVDFDGTWFAPTQSYINNADEFFAAIESLDKSSKLAYIDKQIFDITSTYMTKSEFEGIIGNYQGALEYGDHIAIVNDNVLIAYDVISNSQLYEFSTAYVSYSYLSSTTYTKDETYLLVADKINELIGGADTAFDTIQEIAYWIIQQTNYVEIPYSEIDTESGTTYYIYNEVTGKYEEVDAEYIESHPDEQYYKVASLLEEINKINDKIGYVDYSPGVGYTYTGILSDIHELVVEDEIINRELNSVKESLIYTRNTADSALSTAENAYSIAYGSYLQSLAATDIALSTIEKCDTAYNIAYNTKLEVGIPSHEGYYRLMTDEERLSYNDGDSVYRYNSGSNTYTPAIYYASHTDTPYCIWIDPVEATGLHKVAETTQVLAYTSLYNLSVEDNSEMPSYISIDITPDSYTGDPHRIIRFNAIYADYSIDDMKIHKDGLITAYNINELLSYLVSWDYLE